MYPEIPKGKLAMDKIKYSYQSKQYQMPFHTLSAWRLLIFHHKMWNLLDLFMRCRQTALKSKSRSDWCIPTITLLFETGANFNIWYHLEPRRCHWCTTDPQTQIQQDLKGYYCAAMLESNSVLTYNYKTQANACFDKTVRVNYRLPCLYCPEILWC